MPRRVSDWRICIACAALASGVACGGGGSPTAPTAAVAAPTAPAPAPAPSGPATGFGTAVLVAAGDIADCSSNDDEATARLLDGIDGTVVTLGDNAYDDGAAEEFANCYDPTWGRHKLRTRPSPGNHDYHTSNAAPYFAYFGDRAGLSGVGYYSFDAGAWHIVSLNSNVSARRGSAQEQWLRADLAATASSCTLAYWHHPLFSSGKHGDNSKMLDIWRTLYEFKADVVLNGHDHDYERFGPQTPDGAPDLGRGIREFVVGTGGRSLRTFERMEPNSEMRIDSSYGVLRLDLADGAFTWSFVGVASGTLDSGMASCVN